MLQADEGLRQLRFRLVPRYCSEEQFWQRYFAAVAKVKQRVKAEQAWGDFDMLDDEDEENAGIQMLLMHPVTVKSFLSCEVKMSREGLSPYSTACLGFSWVLQTCIIWHHMACLCGHVHFVSDSYCCTARVLSLLLSQSAGGS